MRPDYTLAKTCPAHSGWHYTCKPDPIMNNHSYVLTPYSHVSITVRTYSNLYSLHNITPCGNTVDHSAGLCRVFTRRGTPSSPSTSEPRTHVRTYPCWWDMSHPGVLFKALILLVKDYTQLYVHICQINPNPTLLNPTQPIRLELWKALWYCRLWHWQCHW